MIKKRLKDKKEIFEKELASFFIAKKEFYTPTLYTAMEYSLFGGGKRIRPILMWLVSDFLGMKFNNILKLAIGIELIHTYSLIHDDLPSMDNDDYRRGKPTLHKKHGEANAILAGDALLNLAYETMFDAVDSDIKLLLSAKLIAKCSGGEGMIGGQVEDIGMKNPSPKQILQMYNKKTGCLIKAAVMSPCYLYKDEKVFEDMDSYGEMLGLIFQLSDDVLDVEDNDKNSFVNNMGKEKTLQLLFDLNSKIKTLLDKYGEKGRVLVDFADFLTTRTI